MSFDIKQYRPRFYREQYGDGEMLIHEQNRTCIMCPNKLRSHERYYCSGDCLREAKKAGLYGNEDKPTKTN